MVSDAQGLKDAVHSKWVVEEECQNLKRLLKEKELDALDQQQNVQRLETELGKTQAILRESEEHATQQGVELEDCLQINSQLKSRIAELELLLNQGDRRQVLLNSENEALKDRIAKQNKQMVAATASGMQGSWRHNVQLEAVQEQLRETQARLKSVSSLETLYSQRVSQLEGDIQELLASKEAERKEWNEQMKAYKQGLEVSREANTVQEDRTKEWMERCIELEGVIQELNGELEAQAVASKERNQEATTAQKDSVETADTQEDIVMDMVKIPSRLLEIELETMVAEPPEGLNNEDLYLRYVEVIEAYNQEHKQRVHGSVGLQYILEKLREKSQRVDQLEHCVQLAMETNMRSESAYATLQQENTALKESLEEQKSLVGAKNNKRQVQMHSRRDLSVQVRSLLLELDKLKCGDLRMFEGSIPASTDGLYGWRALDERKDPISTNLVAVHNLKEVQQQNQQLRDALRAVALEAEQNQNRLVEGYEKERDRAEKAWQAQVAHLKEELVGSNAKHQEALYERDFYFSMAAEGKTLSVEELTVAGSSGVQTIPGTKQEQLDKLNSEVAKLEEEVSKSKDNEAFLAVTRDRVKHLEQDLESTQQELAKLRAQVDFKESRAASLESTNKLLQSECEITREDIAEQRRLVTEWLNRAREVAKQADDASVREHELLGRVDGLETENRILKEANARSLEEMRAMVGNYKQIQEKLLDCSAQCNSKSAELGRVKAENAKLATEKSVVTAQLVQTLNHLKVQAGKVAKEASRLKLGQSGRTSMNTAVDELHGNSAESIEGVSKLEGQAGKEATQTVQTAIDNSTDVVGELENELKVTKEALAVVQRNADHLQEVAEQCNREMETQRKQMDNIEVEHKGNVEAKDTAIASLQSELQSSRQTIERLQIDVQGFEEQTQHVYDLQNKIEDLKAKLNAKGNGPESVQRIRTMETELASLRASLKEYKASMEEARSEASMLRDEVEKTREETRAALSGKTELLETAEKSAAEFRRQYELLLQRLQQDSNDGESVEDNWEEVIEFLRKERDSAAGRLATVEDELALKACELDQSLTEIAELRTRLQQQAEREAQMTRTQEEHEITVNKLKQLSVLSAQVASLQDQEEVMLKSNHALEAQKKALEEENGNMLRKVSTLQARLDEMGTMATLTKQQMEEKDSEILRLGSDLAASRKVLEELRELKRTSQALAQKNDAMEKSILAQNKRMQGVEAELDSKTKETVALSTEVAAAKNALKVAELQNQALKNDAASLKLTIEQPVFGQERLRMEKDREKAALQDRVQNKEAEISELRSQIEKTEGNRKRAYGDLNSSDVHSVATHSSGNEDMSLGRRSSGSGQRMSKVSKIADHFRKAALDRVRLQGGLRLRKPVLQQYFDAVPGGADPSGSLQRPPFWRELPTNDGQRRGVELQRGGFKDNGGSYGGDSLRDAPEYMGKVPRVTPMPFTESFSTYSPEADFGSEPGEGVVSDPEGDGQGRKHVQIKWQPTPRMAPYSRRPRGRGRGHGSPGVGRNGMDGRGSGKS